MKFNINGNIVEVKDEDLNKAIEDKAESFEIKSDDLEVRTKADFETFTNNLKTSSQVVGEEIGRKNLLNNLEIEFEGTGAHKDVEKSAGLLKTWSDGIKDAALKDANIAPDKKVKELQTDLETMKSNFNSAQGERDAARNDLSSFKTGIAKNNEISRSLPDNLSIPKDDMMLILANKVNIGKDDSGTFVGFKSDGSVMKNANLEPLPLKEVIAPFFDANPQYITKSSGGAGGGDSGGGSSKQTPEEFQKEMAEQGIRPGSDKFIEIMQSRLKDDKLAL